MLWVAAGRPAVKADSGSGAHSSQTCEFKPSHKPTANTVNKSQPFLNSVPPSASGRRVSTATRLYQLATTRLRPPRLAS